MKTARHTVLTALAAASLAAGAQQVPEYGQYSQVPFLYNPALAGAGTSAMAHLLRKDQWLDFPGSGSTNLLAVEGPLRENHSGVGISLFHDEKGIVATSGAYLTYAYAVRLGEQSRLRFGLSAGAADHSVDFAKAVVRTAADPALTGERQKTTVFDAVAGLAFMAGDRFTAGLAAPRLLQSTADYATSGTEGTAGFRFRRHYVATIQYRADFGRGDKLSLTPLALLRYVPGAPPRLDGNLTMSLAGAGWLSVTWKSGYAAGAGAGLHIGKALKIGYAYDFILNDLKGHAGLSHEVLLGFAFGPKPKTDNGQADTLIARLNASNDDLRRHLIENEREIQRLRAKITQIINDAFDANDRLAESNERLVNDLLDSIQALNDRLAMGGTKEKEKAETSFRTGSSKTFTDGSAGARRGYYIVVGAFRNKELAERQRAELNGESAGMLFNGETLFYYVYQDRSDTMEGALSSLWTTRKAGHPHAWIYLLK